MTALRLAPAQAVGLLCACADYRACHRTLIARTLCERAFGGRLTIRDLRKGEVVAAANG